MRHVVPFKPVARQTAARPVLPPEVFAAVRDMWTAVLVRDYLTRHATDGVDTSSAPLYNASIASGGSHGENGPASGEAKAANQSEDHRHGGDLDGAPTNPTRAGHDHGV